jgi:hypothetical protein
MRAARAIEPFRVAALARAPAGVRASAGEGDKKSRRAADRPALLVHGNERTRSKARGPVGSSCLTPPVRRARAQRPPARGSVAELGSAGIGEEHDQRASISPDR